MLSKSSNLICKNVLRNAAVFTQSVPQRGIKLHEYQAGQLLHKYNVSIPLGEVAFTKEDALKAAQSFDGHKVVKSQILGGGRGMGHFKETQFQGGVHIVPSADEAASIAEKMIGNHLVTKQSGEDGLPVNCVYIVEKVNIDKEMYLSITLDRAAGCATFIYSPAGGMAIEDVAHETPEKIFKLPVDPVKGMDACDLSNVATNLGIPGKEDQVNKLLKQLYQVFVERDCDMVEINPLITTKDGVVMCADSKITIDDNAGFRQQELKD
jgi:succinyl-CoA synthetase beta subunit